MFGIYAAAEAERRYFRELAVIEAAQPTAAAQGKTECCRSGVCCWRRPGSLAPDDLPRIAAHLGATVEQLFRDYLIVDQIAGQYTVLPRRAHQTGGQMIDARETYSLVSPCVFLVEENACAIHEAKPLGCREFRCWDDDPHSGIVEWSRAAAVRIGWDGTEPD